MQTSEQGIEQFLEELIQVNPEGVAGLLRRFYISNEPTPRILVLASVKHGEPFIDELADLATSKADEDGLLNFAGIDTSVMDRYSDAATMQQGILIATANSELSQLEKENAAKRAKQEQVKQLIYGGIQAVQQGAEYLKNKKNDTFQKPAQAGYDVNVKKADTDNAKKYYWIAGGVIGLLILAFAVVVIVKKRKS